MMVMLLMIRRLYYLLLYIMLIFFIFFKCIIDMFIVILRGGFEIKIFIEMLVFWIGVFLFKII